MHTPLWIWMAIVGKLALKQHQVPAVNRLFLSIPRVHHDWRINAASLAPPVLTLFTRAATNTCIHQTRDAIATIKAYAYP